MLMQVMILFKIVIYLFAVLKRRFLWRINNQRFLSVNFFFGTTGIVGMNRVGIKYSSACKEEVC